MTKINMNMVVHYGLTGVLVFSVIAELVQPSVITSMHHALGSIGSFIGENLHHVVDVAAIKGDKQNIIAYLSLLYLIYVGLYGALYVLVLQKFKETSREMYPVTMRGYYKFQCLTFYSWAPLLFPHVLFHTFYISDSRSGDGASQTFSEALRNYATSTSIWLPYMAILFVLFFLSRGTSFLNGVILGIPLTFELTTLLLVSLQVSTLFDILVLISALIFRVRGE